MIIALHLSSLCSRWTDDLLPYLEPLAEAGFGGIELSLYQADLQKVSSIAQETRKLGLQLSFGTGLAEDTDISSAEPGVRSKGVNYLKSCIDLAAETGARHINGVLYAPWMTFADTPAGRTERLKRSAEALHSAGSYAKQHRVRLHPEALNRFETDMLNTLSMGCDFLEMVGCDAVRLLADTFHMNIEEDNLAAAVESHFEQIGCLHLSENHRGFPGTGHIPWHELLCILKNRGYEGFLTIECFVKSDSEVGRALRIWRDSGEPLAQAIEGLRFLQSLLEEDLG